MLKTKFFQYIMIEVYKKKDFVLFCYTLFLAY